MEVDRVLAAYKRDKEEYHRRMGVKGKAASSATTAKAPPPRIEKAHTGEERRDRDSFYIGGMEVQGVNPNDPLKSLAIINDHGEIKLVGTFDDYTDLFTPTPEYSGIIGAQYCSSDKLLDREKKYFRRISRKENGKLYFELVPDNTPPLSTDQYAEWPQMQKQETQRSTAHLRHQPTAFDTQRAPVFDTKEPEQESSAGQARHQEIKQWLEGRWGADKTINFSDLPSDSIAWFGTAHKGFDQDNGDNNGYAWLSNYHESGEINPNSSFTVNYAIKVKVDGTAYQANNVETFYHLYKLFSNNGKYPNEGKALTLEERKKRYQEFVSKNPNAARAAARNIRKFDYGNADQLMFHLLRQKFMNNSKMARALLDTGESWLLEGNRWGDNRFGIAFNEPNPANGPPPRGSTLSGQNKLGKMLITIRTEIAQKMKTDAEFAKFLNAREEINYEWVGPCDFNNL